VPVRRRWTLEWSRPSPAPIFLYRSSRTVVAEVTTRAPSDWRRVSANSISMAIAGVAFFLALQAAAGRLPFDIAEADQEIMGGSLVEQSGPRLALFRWTMWVKQLVFAFLLVEVFFPWPYFAAPVVDLAATIVKVLVVLTLVAVVEVVNPRLRIDQAMGYFMRVGVSSLAALAFAVIGK
jgi:formate hydrogenlyase subunit 4